MNGRCLHLLLLLHSTMVAAVKMDGWIHMMQSGNTDVSYVEVREGGCHNDSRIFSFGGFTKVVAGTCHVAGLRKDGRIYTSGCNSVCQIGNSSVAGDDYVHPVLFGGEGQMFRDVNAFMNMTCGILMNEDIVVCYGGFDGTYVDAGDDCGLNEYVRFRLPGTAVGISGRVVASKLDGLLYLVGSDDYLEGLEIYKEEYRRSSSGGGGGQQQHAIYMMPLLLNITSWVSVNNGVHGIILGTETAVMMLCNASIVRGGGGNSMEFEYGIIFLSVCGCSVTTEIIESVDNYIYMNECCCNRDCIPYDWKTGQYIVPTNVSRGGLMCDIVDGFIRCNENGNDWMVDGPVSMQRYRFSIGSVGNVTMKTAVVAAAAAVGGWWRVETMNNIRGCFAELRIGNDINTSGVVTMISGKTRYKEVVGDNEWCVLMQGCETRDWKIAVGKEGFSGQIVNLGAGYAHTCVVLVDGAVKCTGPVDECQYLMEHGGDSRVYTGVYTGKVGRVNRMYIGHNTSCFISEDDHRMQCSGSSVAYRWCNKKRLLEVSGSIGEVWITEARLCYMNNGIMYCVYVGSGGIVEMQDSAMEVVTNKRCNVTSENNFICNSSNVYFEEGNNSITTLVEGGTHTVVLTDKNQLCCRSSRNYAGCGAGNDPRDYGYKMVCVSDIVVDKVEGGKINVTKIAGSGGGGGASLKGGFAVLVLVLCCLGIVFEHARNSRRRR